MEDPSYDIILNELREIMKNVNAPGHGIDHFIAVYKRACKAATEENLPLKIKTQIIMAALLHDIDEKKFFPHNKNDENARCILSKLDYTSEDIEHVIDMIRLVSCSQNGDSTPPFPYMCIPRDCDRLEAIGKDGVKRAVQFAEFLNEPFTVDSTEKAFTIDDINRIVTRERFDKYASGTKSVSVIDHFYDKLLHIGKPEYLKSGNAYILRTAEKYHDNMVRYVLNYWLTSI